MKLKLVLLQLLLCLSSFAQTDTSAWDDVRITQCLENEQVHGFITKTVYPSSYINYVSSYFKKYSKVLPYCDAETSYRKDHPADVVIPLPERTTNELYLTYIDSLHQNHVDTVVVPADTMEVRLRNLIPSRTYYYYIQGVTSGVIHTTGQFRQLNIEGGFNVRDIGGYMTTNGKRLRYGRILRGCEITDGKLANLSQSGLKELRRIGVRAELDLRSTINCASGSLSTSSAIGDDVDFLSLPMLDNDSLLVMYPNEYKTAFEFIYDELSHGKPVYIHCTYGADRTGVLCALIESLCGVSLSDMYKDYEMSSMSNDAIVADMHRYYTTVNNRIVRKLTVNSATLVTYSVRKYLTSQCGISSDLLNSLVDLLLDDGTEPDPDDAIINIDNDEGYSNKAIATYDLNGIRQSAPRKGISLIRDSKGQVKKVLCR